MMAHPNLAELKDPAANPPPKKSPALARSDLLCARLGINRTRPLRLWCDDGFRAIPMRIGLNIRSL